MSEAGVMLNRPALAIALSVLSMLLSFPALKDCVAANRQAVVASPARPQAADALVLECGPSTVRVGEIGQNGVLATTVSHDPVRSSRSIIHHLADSTVVA